MNKEKVGYLGPVGSFSSAVCRHLYPSNEEHEFVLCENVDRLIKGLRDNEIDYALVPVSNSKTGAVARGGREVLSYLFDDSFYIVGEKYWTVVFYLLGYPGTKLENIKMVHAFEYADQYCASYFARHPNWDLEYHASSSDAAKIVSDLASNENAALSSIDAAQLYKLEILDSRIFVNDFDYPVLHYIILSKKPRGISHVDKPEDHVSSFIFTHDDHKILARLLKESDLGLYHLHNFKDTNKYYFALHGVYNLPQVKILTQATTISSCGVFLADPQRKYFAPLFYETA